MAGILIHPAKKVGVFALKKALRTTLVNLDEKGIIPSSLLEKFKDATEKIVDSIDVLRHKVKIDIYINIIIEENLE